MQIVSYETTRSYSTNYPLSLATAPGANDGRHLNRKEGVGSTRADNTMWPLLHISFTPVGEDGRGDSDRGGGNATAEWPLDKLGGGDPWRPEPHGFTSRPTLSSRLFDFGQRLLE